MNPRFKPSPSIETARSLFIDIEVDVAKVLESWRESLFSFEWLDEDGTIKPLKDLSVRERPKREEIEALLAKNEALEMPVLGIGIHDNVEIGSGRAVFLTLAAHGCKIMPVHIPKSCESDFKPYLS